MTRPGIELRSPGTLANTLTTRPIDRPSKTGLSLSIYIYRERERPVVTNIYIYIYITNVYDA